MIIEALAYRCGTSGCPKSVAPILVRYRPDFLYGYNPGDLPDGVQHLEWESEDPRNTPLDGFVTESGLFCLACGTRMTRMSGP